jgi:hypothetical protein
MFVNSRRVTRFIGRTALGTVIVIRAFGGELPSSFQEAKQLADAQEQGAATRDYFAKTLLPYYADKFGPVLRSCFAEVKNPSRQRFGFVAAIDLDGHVMRLYNDGETNIFHCMRDSLVRQIFPSPSVAPYYLHIDMQFTDDKEPKQYREDNKPPLVLEPNRYSYTFGVPKGWDYSFEQAQGFGIRLVFFPEHGSFRESNSTIYVNELCKSACTGMTQQSIDKIIQDSREDSPALRVATEPPIKIKQGGKAIVRLLTGARDPRQAKEALAFIEHKDAIVLVVLTTQDASNWTVDYAAFQEMVSSHRFFSCNSADLVVPCH